ncbi:alkaline phosphatase D [Nocardioides scoriae]|uniref:Alkaline phosphatase D n=1 Tax=Nocardioides scoriae TaxID=642780 RepID=A0A1H1N4V7_9ACTN|nr:alkaline phosphatase D family protein [Nocardioides scoriae]SDR94026.1 alkaline phosphatase D [Nocardioides scoriae]
MASSPFAHGVASGDPRPTSVVLWTRVTPTLRSTPGSGVGPDVTVRWQVATGPGFTRVVRSGRVRTGAARDHTVKVDATGLAPGRTYWYRFLWDGRTSRTGRTRTAPATASAPARVRLGVVSCANLQAGWFSAYRHLADRDDLDAVLHLGDYVYEYGPGEYGYGRSDRDVRVHEPAHETRTLADYRQRHAQYKRDTDLQRLHARVPFVVTWDDHESANDAWRGGAENHSAGEGSWAARRAASHQAYDEWMPVRMSGTAASGDGDGLYRRLRFGTLVELTLLDLRSYRDQQLAAPVDPAQADPDRTLTGRAQMDFLKASLTTTAVQWKLVGNPVMIAPVTFAGVPREAVRPVDDTVGLLPPEGVPYNVDQWDGYTDDRREVFEHLRDHGVTDTVFVTGDIHSAWACDLPADKATYAATRSSVGVELVGTSVTSNNLKDITGSPPRTTSIAVEEALKANNPHVQHIDFDDHGYSVLDLTPKRAQMDWYVIGDRADRGAAATWSVSYATTAGSQVLHRVPGPVAR